MGTTASNQHLAGIDLSQTGSDLGSSEGSSQLPKEQLIGDKVAKPKLSKRNDPLLKELRKQCKLHRTEINFLDSLDLPGAPYQYFWLGTGCAELAPLLPDVQPLSLEQIGAEADPQEFEAASISFVGRNENKLYIRYQDGTVECCAHDPHGKKHGPFALYYPSLPYLENAPFKLNSHLVQHSGFFFKNLPCGPFELCNEHGVCVGKGCYELMEAGICEQSKEIGLQQLYKLIDSNQQEEILRRMLCPNGRFNLAAKYTRWQTKIPVCLDRIVVRYVSLSHRLPHGQIHSFEVGPEHPAILLERHDNETWMETCMRAHRRVLNLVQMQVNELMQAQRAAAQLLDQEQAAEQDPELLALQEQLAVPLYDNEVGQKVHQRCLEDLGKLQPKEIIANCERSRYAPGLLDCLTRTTDGRYLNGLLVSSPEYYERQSYRRMVKQKSDAEFNTSLQVSTKQCDLSQGDYLDYLQNEEDYAPDPEQRALTVDEIDWLIDQFAPALHDDADDMPLAWCEVKHWGELQLQDRDPKDSRPHLAPTQYDLKHLLSYTQQNFEFYLQRSDLTSYGLRWGHYFYLGRRGSLAKDSSCHALPIWAHWDITPINVETPLDLLAYYFCWHAVGTSSLYDATGTCLGQIGYDQFGLCDGTFQLNDEANETSMYGYLQHGQLQPTLTFTIYQDFRARFPAATLTVDLAQDLFVGPYHTIYSIDELFEKGYHAVMLEVYGTIQTEEGTKRLKRLIKYTPDTYLDEDGVYLADGTVQVTKKHILCEYESPSYSRDYDYDWDCEEDDENDLDAFLRRMMYRRY